MTDVRQAGCCPPGRSGETRPRLAESAARVVSGRGRHDAGIVWLEGGRSFVGTLRVLLPQDGEKRRRTVLAPFGIDRVAVTNARFAAFVDATGYRTVAERFGWSFVFRDALTPEVRASSQRVVEVPWWHRIDGADWRHPEGPGSAIDGRLDHPAVHVAWDDAVAFARWDGSRLPTEGEWEFAARGGQDVAYPWGDEDPDDRHPLCNIWQGAFPDLNLATDGYQATAPVESFAPNPFGLFNMAGNVWEWCADPFRVRSLSTAGKARDAEARRAQERVLKGGSFLCHRSYCHRYRIAARMGRPTDTSSSHIGFRVAHDPAPDGETERR